MTDADPKYINLRNVLYSGKGADPDPDSKGFIGVAVTKEINMYAVWDIVGYNFDSAIVEMVTYTADRNKAIECAVDRGRTNKGKHNKDEQC